MTDPAPTTNRLPGRGRHRTVGLVGLVAGWVLLGWSAPGCRKSTHTVETGVTGINLTVRYKPADMLTALDISGRVTGDAGEMPAFTMGTLPKTPRPLSSTGSETAALLLPASLGGTTIVVRIDGRAGGKVVASEQQAIPIESGRLVDSTVVLGPPAICGDGFVLSKFPGCSSSSTGTSFVNVAIPTAGTPSHALTSGMGTTSCQAMNGSRRLSIRPRRR